MPLSGAAGQRAGGNQFTKICTKQTAATPLTKLVLVMENEQLFLFQFF